MRRASPSDPARTLPGTIPAALRAAPLPRKMMIAVGLVVLASFTLFIFSNYRATAREYRSETLAVLESIAVAQGHAIDQIVAGYIGTMRMISSRTAMRRHLAAIQDGAPDAQAVARINKIVSDAAAADPGIRAVALYRRDGLRVAGAGALHLTEARLRAPSMHDRFSGLVDLDHQVLVAVSGPITRDGELLGAIEMLSDPGPLRGVLETAQAVGKTGIGTLACRRDGRLVTLHAPEPADAGTQVPFSASALARTLQGHDGLFPRGFVGADTHHLIVASQHLAEHDLALTVQIDASEVIAHNHAYLQRSLLLGALCLTLTLALVWLVTRRLLEPLTRLTAYARSFGRDGHVLPPPRGGSPELVLLGDTLGEAGRRIRERESALVLAERRLRAILEHMLDAVFVLDVDGNIQYANPAAHRMFGYAAGGIEGSHIKQLAPERNHARVASYLGPQAGVGASDSPGSYRTAEGRRQDGSVFPLSVATSRLEVDGETLLACLVHDLTEIHAVQQALEERNEDLSRANRELEEFVYIASHDLRSPLRAVDNLMEWISDDLADSEVPQDVSYNIGRARDRVGILERMIEDLLAYSRAGRGQFETEAVDLPALLRDVLALVEPPEGMTVAFDSDLATAQTSRTALETVLRNLISNAIQHHDHEQGQIRIEAEARGNGLRWRVIDDGPGIEERFQERIFRLFETLEPRDTTGSTGMGLAVVKRLIERHGGSIRVQSPVADGRGTCFEFDWGGPGTPD